MEELLKNLIDHPLSFLLSIFISGFSIYWTIKIAKNIKKDLDVRNAKIGFKDKATPEGDGAACLGLIFVALLSYVAAYALFTWIGTMLPVHMGL